MIHEEDIKRVKETLEDRAEEWPTTIVMENDKEKQVFDLEKKADFARLMEIIK